MAEVVDDVAPGRSPSPGRKAGGARRGDDDQDPAKAALADAKAADLADITDDDAASTDDDQDPAKAALADAKAADLADITDDDAASTDDDQDPAKAALADAKAADLADITGGTTPTDDLQDPAKAALADAKAADLADITGGTTPTDDLQDPAKAALADAKAADLADNSDAPVPTIDELRSDDPRDTLDPVDFGAQAVVDVTANVPEGMSVDTTPAGVPTGADRLGVGDDALLDGRMDSPLDDLPSPSTSSAGPPEATLIGGRDMSQYGVITDTTAPDPPPPPPPPPPTTFEYHDTSDDWMDELEVQRQTNPDAGDAAPPTDEEIERAITVRGGDTKPIDGERPSIDLDEPPAPPGDLVTDPGPEAESTDIVDAPAFAPDAVVVHTINPDSGVVPVRSSTTFTGQDDVLGLSESKVASVVEARPLDQQASLADHSIAEIAIIIPDVDSVGLVDVTASDLPLAYDDDNGFADQLDPGGAEPLEGSAPGDLDGGGFPDG